MEGEIDRVEGRDHRQPRVERKSRLGRRREIDLDHPDLDLDLERAVRASGSRAHDLATDDMRRDGPLREVGGRERLAERILPALPEATREHARCHAHVGHARVLQVRQVRVDDAGLVELRDGGLTRHEHEGDEDAAHGENPS